MNEQRVYAYLASIPLTRKVTSTGQLHLYGAVRSVGRATAGQTVSVECDPQAREWVVTQADGTAVKRLPIHDLDVTSLTGIAATPTVDLPPFQLTLPLAA